MSQFLIHHPIEDFFINPTMTQDNSMEMFARISVMSESPSKVRLNHDEAVKTVRPVSTIHDLFLAHNYRTSYSSEEESASPRDSEDDGISLHSNDEDMDVSIHELNTVTQPNASTIDMFLVPEELANSCQKLEHKCNRAQAVIVKHVGKPKMVSMPKVVDIPARPGHFKRVSNESMTRPGTLRREESKKSIKSVQPTLRFAEEQSALPTPREEPEDDSAPDPATPSVEVKGSETPSRPTTRISAAFDPFPRLSDIAAGKNITIQRSMTVSGALQRRDTDGSTSTSQMSPARRGLHRIASTISNASSLVRRKSSISSIRRTITPSESIASIAASSPKLSLHLNRDPLQMAMHPIPERSSSMNKLVPRGATERAPILVLPPFPGDEDDEEDDDFGDASHIRGMQKWDRPRARQAAKIRKMRPTIDGVVAGAV